MLNRAYIWLGLAIVASVLVDPRGASAQDWLADRARAEGPGIRVGDLELHPGVGAEIGYDSNVFYEDQSPVGSAILRGTGHLLVSTIGPERRAEGEARGGSEALTFRGGLSVSGYHYFIDSARDNVEGDLALDVTLNPRGTFSFRIYEEFARAIRPFTDAGGEAARLTYGRNRNTAGVEASLRSRSDILKGKLGYELGYEFFDDDDFQYANNLEHRVALGVSFRFFPQTALLNETKLEFRTYPNAGDMPSTLVSDGIRVTSMVGLNGAFTNTISASILGGYSAGFYEQADDFESVVLRIEGRWNPSPTTRVTLGYDRQFRPSFIGNFFREDRGYIGFQVLAAGAFLLGVDGGVAYYETGVALAPDAMTPVGTQTVRSGVRADARLFAEYRATNWFGINTSLRYVADFTDFAYVDPGPTDPLPDPAAAYQKFEAWLGVRAFY